MIPDILTWIMAALGVALAVAGVVRARAPEDRDAEARAALELLRTANRERRPMTPAEWNRYTAHMDRVRAAWAREENRG